MNGKFRTRVNSRGIFRLVLCSLLLIFFAPLYKSDVAALVPTASDNLAVRLQRTSDLVATSDGYMRVFQKDKMVGIEYYDNSFRIKSRKTIPLELEYWGGFFNGSDSYYLVEGKSNEKENDAAEVIRVIRYNKSWKKTGSASITGNSQWYWGKVRHPFWAGCVEMAEQNGKLYIATGHEGYVDESVGQGHQGFLMIEVDLASMKGRIVAGDLWHSFAQYIKSENSYLYVLEQSEGSRYTKLSRYNTASNEVTSLNVFSYGGNRTSAWAIDCYASVDGMAVAADNILCIGTSIDQKKYTSVLKNKNIPHNIYLTVTPKNNFTEKATVVKQLTNYTGGGKCFLGVKITKINDNRFMISWEEYGSRQAVKDNDDLSGSILHYLFIDGKGNKVSKEMTKSAPVSNCQPVVKKGKVVYYASNSNMVNFYSIDSKTGAFSQKNYQIAGENATWNFKNGVLTISGQGALSLDKSSSLRFPISVIPGQHRDIETPWENIWARVKRIVIQPGITSISEKEFISCYTLSRIDIPASVKKIGDNFIWKGSYGLGNKEYVCDPIIYAPYGSTAIAYAKKNEIRYAIDLSHASVSGLKKSYTCTGKALKPVPTVKMGNAKLKQNRDFKISYKNNTQAGTATVTVTGTGNYYGNCKTTFQIVKKKEADVKSFSDAWNVYTVTKAKSTVAIKKSKITNPTTLHIPATVKYKGVKYKVTSISANAFKNCKKVKQVTISGSVASIGAGAFQGCTGLTTLKVGTGVTTIGTKAFYDCRSLTSAAIQTTKLTAAKTGKNAFTNAGKNNYKKLNVKVPKSKLALYKKILQSRGLSGRAKITK